MPRNKLSPLDIKIRTEISNNLKKYSRGITQVSLSEKTGIPVSTLSGYFAKRSTPNAGSLQKIAEALGVNKSDLDPRFADDEFFSKKDIPNIVSIYERLTPERQQNVYNYADNQLREQNNTIVRMPRTQIKLLGAVSAGTGEELQDDTTEVDYTGTVPEYDYALQVNGDSMEPLFTDQQIIFVKYSEEAFNGQIVIAYVDGKAYVKKYHCNGAKCELVSLNSKYEPIDVSGNENFKIKGVVVL